MPQRSYPARRAELGNDKFPTTIAANTISRASTIRLVFAENELLPVCNRKTIAIELAQALILEFMRV